MGFLIGLIVGLLVPGFWGLVIILFFLGEGTLLGFLIGWWLAGDDKNQSG